MSKLNTLDLVTNLNLEAERKIATQSNKAARVKIERGDQWLVRFLPFPQGSNRQPFAPIAQHWIGTGPGARVFNCVRHTPKWFGGNPDAACAVCDIAEQMYNEATDDDERDLFYQVQHRMSFRSYCLVLAKQNDRGVQEDMDEDEILTPYEFLISKSAFANLETKINRSKTRPGSSPLGLLDIKTGCDLWAMRDKKNSLSFDLGESGPIFPLDDQFEVKLQRVWKQLKQPTMKFLSDERLNALADMIYEKQFDQAARALENSRDDGRGENGRSSGRSGSQGHGRFHEAEDESRPSRAASSNFARAKAAIEGPAPREEQVSNAASAETEQETQIDEPAQEETPPAVSTRRGSSGSAIRPAVVSSKVSVPPSVVARRRVGAAPPPPAAKSDQGGRIEDETSAEDLPEEATDSVLPAEPDRAPVEPKSAGPARGALHREMRKNFVN